MKLNEVEVGQVLRPVRGGNISTDKSERYKVTRKLRDAILAINKRGHEVLIDAKNHLAELQVDNLATI